MTSKEDFERYREEIELYKKSPCWLIVTGIMTMLSIAKIIGFIVFSWNYIFLIGFGIIIIVCLYEPKMPN